MKAISSRDLDSLVNAQQNPTFDFVDDETFNCNFSSRLCAALWQVVRSGSRPAMTSQRRRIDTGSAPYKTYAGSMYGNMQVTVVISTVDVKVL